jgi:hypothetical protein
LHVNGSAVSEGHTTSGCSNQLDIEIDPGAEAEGFGVGVGHEEPTPALP